MHIIDGRNPYHVNEVTSTPQRPDWCNYFLAIAEVVASRASCLRAKVGAVIVAPDHSVISIGYNGAPSGEISCLEAGCLMEDNHCQRCLHAEVNAVAWTSRHGTVIPEGSMIYIWSNRGDKEPCRECRKVLTAVRLPWIL